MEIKDVTVHARADVRFGGKLIAHACLHPNGDMTFLGVVMPGTFHVFMIYDGAFEITEGAIEITVDGSLQSKSYATGDHAVLNANHGFTVTVTDLPCQYIGTRLQG